MFSFLLPKAVKQGRQFVHDARKMVAYKRDLWSERTCMDFESSIAALEKANATHDKAQIEAAARTLDQLCHEHLPTVHDAGWRENVEVFLVAIVIALAVRTFFLQPFTIPTGSMQPTLNGILGYPTQEEPPNALVQLFHTAVFGRTWINTVAREDESVAEVAEIKRFFFFSYTMVRTAAVTISPEGAMQIMDSGNTYYIHAPMRTLIETFGVNSTRIYRGGEPIARGYINTGDHVFVDKFTYHFRPPKRSEVFVFTTQNVPTGENRVRPNGPSQFYIKRLVGLPGDELRIDSPALFINGQPPEEKSIQRVIAAQDGYRGYTFGFPSFLMPILRAPDDSYAVPAKHYFAMGDNSNHSSDSRDWGPVPERNIMGRGVFVYWPFAPHWGPIR